MSTRAEDFRTEQQRKGPRSAKDKVKDDQETLETEEATKTHTEKKAAYVLEQQSEEGRPSRKSTRKSANRAKPDTNLVLRATREVRSPKSRHTKAVAKTTRVSGSPNTSP